MYRKFWLVNSLGKKYEFTNKNFNYFLSDPSDLGYQKQTSILELGNVNKIVSSKHTIQSPRGELLFWGETADVYNDYQQFMQFIKYQPVTFHALLPNSTEEYYKEGTIIQTDKAEQKEDNILRCPFVFQATTHWRTSKIETLSITGGTSGDGKSYPLSYPYHYSGSNLNDISLTVKGTLPVGFIIEIIGETTNPEFFVYNQNGVQYGAGKINGTYDYVRVNSVDGEEEIYLERNGSVIANAASYQDLSIAGSNAYKTFIKMNPGENKMTFALDGSFLGDIKVSWRNAYASI